MSWNEGSKDVSKLFATAPKIKKIKTWRTELAFQLKVIARGIISNHPSHINQDEKQENHEKKSN